jgi:hypothetical protein
VRLGRKVRGELGLDCTTGRSSALGRFQSTTRDCPRGGPLFLLRPTALIHLTLRDLGMIQCRSCGNSTTFRATQGTDFKHLTLASQFPRKIPPPKY